jgi:cell division protein FtsB
VRKARAAFEDALESKSKTELAAKAVGWAYRVRRRAATGAAAVLALLLGYYVVAGQNGLHAYEVKRNENQKLQQQIDAIRQQNAQIQQKIHALKNDPDTIEREARERLHYARPDEVIVTIPRAKKSGSK